MIAWPFLKRSARLRDEPGHRPVARLSPPAAVEGDDADRDILREEGEAAVRGALWRHPVRDAVVHELRKDALHDLLANPGDGHGSLRTRVEARSDERRVAHAAGEHEGRAAGRTPGREATVPVPRDGSDGVVEFDPFPFPGVARQPAVPNRREALFEPPTGLRGRGVVRVVALRACEGDGVWADEEHVRSVEDFSRHPYRVFDGL